MSWLVDTFHESITNNWCMEANCTTCGAYDFRTAIFENAFKSINPNAVLGKTLSRRIHWYRNLSESNTQRIAAELLKELSLLKDLNELSEHGLRLILLELDHKYDGNIDAKLNGTLIGDFLASMRAHADYLSNQRRTTELREEAKRIKKEENLIKHIKRLEHLKANPPKPQADRIANGKSEIHQFLVNFGHLSNSEKIRLLSSRTIAFSLDWIPKPMIPTAANLDNLSPSELEQLLKHIDKRQGKWGRLKSKIINKTFE